MIKAPLALVRRTLISASGKAGAAEFAMQVKFLWLLAGAGALGSGLCALYLGFYPEWDMLNYQLYIPHALLSGRLSLDVTPAQIETFYNPALFIPFYLGFLHLPLEALVFLTGMLQGAQLALLYAIATQLVPNTARHRLLLLPVALLGLLGPVFLEQLGLFRGDTLISLPLLGSVLLLTRELKSMGMETANGASAPRTGTLLLAGALAGLAVALKLPAATYALGLLLATGLAFRGIAPPLLFSLGGAMGLLAGGGPWFAYLWLTYGNPIFPFFNNLHQSDWGLMVGHPSYSLHMPKSWWEALLYPLIWATEPRRVLHVAFFDPRPIILYPLMFILPLAFWRRGRLEFPALWFLLIFLALSYTAWLTLFSNYRYLSALEMLAPIALFAILAGRTHRLPTLLAALLLVLSTQYWMDTERPPANWRFRPDAATSLASLPADSALIIIDSIQVFSYAALWLKDEQPLLRVRSGNLAYGLDNRFAALARQRIRAHEGPLYLLHPRAELQADHLIDDLAAMNLNLESSRCLPLFENADLQLYPVALNRPLVCPLTRIFHQGLR